jgi:hypothetical protein
MAIKSYEKDGKTLYQVYVNVRSKTNSMIRAQRTVSDLQSLALARREENRINLELGKRILELEGKSDTWESIVNKWEKEVRSGLLGEYNSATIRDR